MKFLKPKLLLKQTMWGGHDFGCNEKLVKSLRGSYYTGKDVEKAMLSVDRADFCKYNPYEDAPQSIGYGVTISAPHMHATALDLLKDYLKEGMTALDIGSGKKQMNEFFYFFRYRILNCLYG